MILHNQNDVDSTREKLRRLEARYEALRSDTTEDEHVRAVTMRSLKRYINQFKEDIARYEAQHAVPR
jgi:flagellar biosynthesis chaperone FliJ